MTENNHPHIATPYELKAAAEQRLNAIVFPLMPEPVLVDTKDCTVPRGMEWRWQTPKVHAIWGENDAIAPLVLKGLPWQVGDQVYLQEEWFRDPGRLSTREAPSFDLRRNFPAFVTPFEEEDWQPANTMPPEAAQYWFEIAEVRVCQCKDLAYGTISIPGSGCLNLFHEHRILCDAWDTAYPEHPWEYDLWVVVLQLEPIAS